MFASHYFEEIPRVITARIPPRPYAASTSYYLKNCLMYENNAENEKKHIYI